MIVDNLFFFLAEGFVFRSSLAVVEVCAVEPLVHERAAICE